MPSEALMVQVMPASDLATLYGVSASALNHAVRRNRRRFPSDFRFQLTATEWESLKSHFVTSKRGGVRRALPYAFTEHGVAMRSSVLTSDRAAAVNIAIMHAFVPLRDLLLSNACLRASSTRSRKNTMLSSK
jgi:ORF6N domain-containing protein